MEFVAHPDKADVLIRKAELMPPQEEFFRQEEAIQKQLSQRPSIFMIGEPRELATGAYRFADPRRSLVVAPGTEFKRMMFGRPWSDPQLDGWNDRQDRFVWIARPIGHRLSIAQKLLEWGIPLDIYSREPWPLPCWKGPALDDVETARAYKYRIACENSNTYLYHSEKLFTGIRSGCVTFYWGDPQLDLNFVEGAFLPLNRDNLKSRNDLAPDILQGMSRFMFSPAWEVYSIRSFIDHIAELVRACDQSQPLREHLPSAR